MEELKLSITILGIIFLTILVLLIGAFLDYRIGGKRLLVFCGITALASMIAFAIYAAVVLI